MDRIIVQDYRTRHESVQELSLAQRKPSGLPACSDNFPTGGHWGLSESGLDDGDEGGKAVYMPQYE